MQTCSERVSAASEGLTGGRPLLGAYNPQCDDKGDYKNKQCHGSTGYCWCVDTKSGKEIEGTRKNVRTTGANSFECGEYEYIYYVSMKNIKCIKLYPYVVHMSGFFYHQTSYFYLFQLQTPSR